MEELVSLFFGKAKFHLGKAKQGGSVVDYHIGCYYHHIFHSLWKIWMANQESKGGFYG